MHRKHLVAAVAAVALAGTALGGPASAEDPAAKPKPNVVVKGLVSPLSLAVTDDGTVYYAQNFAGMLADADDALDRAGRFLDARLAVSSRPSSPSGRSR